MSKMSTERVRIALNGPTMGTRWSALFFAPDGFDPAPVQAALQAAVDEVDAQMSTWNADSDLMRLNAAPVGAWVTVPDRLGEVLRLGLEIGRASGGAFDIGMGDAVTAWGFGSESAATKAHPRRNGQPPPPGARDAANRGFGDRGAAGPQVCAHRAGPERHRQGVRRRPAGRDAGRVRTHGRPRRHRRRDARARAPAGRKSLDHRGGSARPRPAAGPIPFSRFRTPPWRPRGTTGTGSRCRAAACRTPWTPVAAPHCSRRPPR